LGTRIVYFSLAPSVDSVGAIRMCAVAKLAVYHGGHTAQQKLIESLHIEFPPGRTVSPARNTRIVHRKQQKVTASDEAKNSLFPRASLAGADGTETAKPCIASAIICVFWALASHHYCS
jgi:hypothetical protein